MEIFKLFGSIFVNTDAADSSMQKTEQKAGGVASTLGKGIATAAKWGTAIVAGATVAATSMVNFATNTAATADTIDKMSQKIGISTEAYQEWDYVMGQNGMDIDKLATGMKTLVAQMDSAASGTKSAQENFDKLGISIYDSSGKLKDQETILNEAMHALADMENGTEKARLATELFGKAGTEMMPMLNQGSEAMDELTQRAHDLGLIMSEDAVAAGVKLGDTIDDIKKSFQAIGTSFGSAIIPIVQQFADLIVENIPLIQQMVGSLTPLLAEMTSTLLPPLVSLAQNILPVIIDLFGQIIPVLSEIFAALLPDISGLLEQLIPPFMQIIEALLPPLMSMIKALSPLLSVIIDLLSPILDLFISLLAPIIDLIAKAITPLIEILGKLIVETLKPFIPVIEAVASVIKGALMGALQGLSPIINSVTKLFGGLIDFVTGIFTGNWKQAWSGVVNIFSSVFQGIVNMAKAPINTIIGAINGLFSSLNGIKIPDWVPVVGGKTFSLPQIPMLAKGGDVVDSGTVLVGEQGPELLNLPRGARVTPLSKDNQTEAIDYNMLLKIIVEALLTVLPEVIIDVDSLRSLMTEVVEAVVAAVGNGGDIIIPVYIGQERITELVVKANQINDYISGGRG